MPEDIVIENATPDGQDLVASSSIDPERAAGAKAELSRYIKSDIFEPFKDARRPFEAIWEECWLNYLGQYQHGLNWRRKTEGKKYRSKVFIKLTTLKCHTAHAKIIDLYAGRGGVPFDCIPINVEEMGIDPEEARRLAAKQRLRLKDHFRTIELEEILSNAILEAAILGTGVLKGPIVETRKNPKIIVRKIGGSPIAAFAQGVNPFELQNETIVLPVVDHVPLWEYYVDPNASSTADSIGEIHFKRMLPAHFRRLAYQGGYDKAAVLEAAERASMKDGEDFKYIQLGDNYTGEHGPKDNRVSALEFQGIAQAELLRKMGKPLPPGTHDDDGVEILAALGADGIVMKTVFNPTSKRQFRVCPYRKRPHSIFGQGVAEAMRDSQKMINSSARLIIDNKALSGNGVLAINKDRIDTKRTGSLDIYPGKTIYTKGNYSPKEVIDSITFPDITVGLQALMEMFERFADEETGIPKYTHGEQGSFLNKTATGISMLMQSANVNLKEVVKNIDDFWIEPIVEDMYAWFVAFQPDASHLPLQIKATGTDSMMAREIKLENYLKFAKIFSAPQDAMLQDRVKLQRTIADILETTDIIRSDDEIKQIVEQLTTAGAQPRNMREIVDIDRLFPFLTPTEQAQILKELGIQPDQQRMQGAFHQQGVQPPLQAPLQEQPSIDVTPTDQPAMAGGAPQ